METVFGLRLVDVMRAVANLQRAAACLDSTRLVLVTHDTCSCCCCSKLGAFVAVAVTVTAVSVAAVLLIYTIIT